MTHLTSLGTKPAIATQPLGMTKGKMTKAKVKAEEQLLANGQVLVGLVRHTAFEGKCIGGGEGIFVGMKNREVSV